MGNKIKSNLMVLTLGGIALVGGFKLFINSNNRYGEIKREVPARVWEVKNEIYKLKSVESLVDPNTIRYYGNLMNEWRGYMEDPNLQSAIKKAEMYDASKLGSLVLSGIGGMVTALGLVNLLKLDKKIG